MASEGNIHCGVDQSIKTKKFGYSEQVYNGIGLYQEIESFGVSITIGRTLIKSIVENIL